MPEQPSVGHRDSAGLAIRRAVPDDAAGLAAVHIASWRHAYRGLLPRHVLDGLDHAARTERWRRNLAPGGSHITLVAVRAATVLGFVSVCAARDDDVPPDVGEVSSLYLAPDSWGLGIGRTLMGRARHLLLEGGFTTALLWVLDGNERAVRFYEADGWRADGTVKRDVLAGCPVLEHRYRTALGQRSNAGSSTRSHH